MKLGCGGTLNRTKQGTIMSPGYNINGTFTYSCDWKLGVNQGPKLNFSMSEVRGNAPYMSVSKTAITIFTYWKHKFG